MGSRLLRHKFLNPSNDPKVLEEHYAYIEEMRTPFTNTSVNTSVEPAWKSVEKFLRIKDVERVNRKIKIKSIKPLDWIELDQDIVKVLALVNIIKEASILKKFLSERENATVVKELLELQAYYRSVLDLDLAAKYTLDSVKDNFFKQGYDKTLDELGYKIKHYEQFFKTMTRSLSHMITPGSDYIALKRGEEIYYLTVTKTRFNQLKSKFNSPLSFTIDDKTYTIKSEDLVEAPVSKKSSNLNIRNEMLTNMSLELGVLHEELRSQVIERYYGFLDEVNKKFGSVLESVSKFVAKIDVFKSIAKVADEYNYCKPVIVAESKSSFMMVKNMRHPIIERINQSVKYVPHSFCLGAVPEQLLGPAAKPNDSHESHDSHDSHESDVSETAKDVNKTQDGMIIFGVNACGKSSLMKSAGVNLILAQAGFYVAASSFIFFPYDQVLTRIIGNDNIFKGQSSFEVEMIELRGILSRARDNRSLVIGDEIAHTTDTASGLAIVAAAIITLAKHKASFIFASHLHSLSSLPRIKELTNVRSYHLRVNYDETNDRLIYDRNLMEGAGSAVYGLEVLKGAHWDESFLKLAHEIRRETMGVPENVIVAKQSKYNSDLYMTQCQVCQGPAEDTHHINMQCTADEKGFIDHYHKNVLANLVVLCKKCHLAVHNRVDHANSKSSDRSLSPDRSLLINGYIETTSGYVLDFKWMDRPKQITDAIDDANVNSKCVAAKSQSKIPIMLKKKAI